MLIQQVEDILDEFDFNKVQKVMEALDWKYHDSVDKFPSIGELRKMARSLLNCTYDADDSPDYFTSCGGFHAERRMYPGDSTKYLNLKFVVTEWSDPCC